MSSATESQQVSWWSVHETVAPYLGAADSWPMAGTVAWQLLQDTDPAKWAAILDAAQHHILRVEICQEAKCEVSQAISTAADWSAIARQIRDRDEFYAARPWLKRGAL